MGPADKTIEKVGAEAAGLDGLPQVSVGRGNHAHVHVQRTAAADRLKLLFLQNAQELYLCL